MALILGRFFPIVRTFAPIFAGVVRVDIKGLLYLQYCRQCNWVTTFTLSGYFLGRRFRELKDYLQYIVLV
jgi:membrane-associated protein